MCTTKTLLEVVICKFNKCSDILYIQTSHCSKHKMYSKHFHQHQIHHYDGHSISFEPCYLSLHSGQKNVTVVNYVVKMPTWCSVSQLFAQHGAISFLAVIHKQRFSLLRSLCSCNNAVICAFVSSDRFWRSPMLAKWRKDLYL